MHWLTLLILSIVNAVLIVVGAAVFNSLERSNSVVELRNIITQRRKFFDAEYRILRSQAVAMYSKDTTTHTVISQSKVLGKLRIFNDTSDKVAPDKYKYVDPDDLEKLLILYSSVSKYGRILSDPLGNYNHTFHDSSTESTRDSTRDSASESARDSTRDTTRDSFRDSIDDAEFDSKWDYSRSCLFTLTVISTIGYGSMSPVTTEGRMFCVVFAIFGIPPFMALIAGCGENIREFIAARTLQRSTSKRFRYLLMFLLTLVCVFLFVVMPAILFQWIEDWPYSDSIYYTIISITTIGFGDLVPNGNMDMAGAVLVAYRVFHFAWLLLGLAWLSTVINSRQAVVVKFFNKHAERLDPWCAVKDLQPGDTTADINSPTNLGDATADINSPTNPGDATADVSPLTNKRLSENNVLEVDRM